MPSDTPTPETFGNELDQVVARHNECFQRAPGYMVAMLIQEAGHRASQHGVDVELLEARDDVCLFEVGDSAAVLTDADDPEVLAGLETEFAMIDHQGMGR